MALFTETYKSLLLDTIKVPSPDCFLRPDGMCWEEHSRNMFAHMERTLAEGHDEIAAVIVEPLIQGAGGMRMYHPVYLKLLREACDRYGVHLIHDEIAVGFGRTGTMFACEQAGIAPDFLCLSKALTGGYLPMSAVLTSETVYRGFYDDYQTLRAFLHSHTYTGNPLACAAALATLDIFEEDKVIEANRALSTHMARATAHLADHPHVAEVRQTGMVPVSYTHLALGPRERILDVGNNVVRQVFLGHAAVGGNHTDHHEEVLHRLGHPDPLALHFLRQ